MMHFMGFDLSSERKYATYGQISEKENDDCALFVPLLGPIFRSRFSLTFHFDFIFY